MALPPAQPALCLAEPAGSSSSLARRQWVDPFRTGVYSGETSFFFPFCCKISSVVTGINKETRLLLAPVLLSLLPWALAGLDPCLRGHRGDRAAQAMSHQVQVGRGQAGHWKTASAGALLCSLAFPPLQWCFPPGSSAQRDPPGCSGLLHHSVHLCILSAPCFPPARVGMDGKGFALLF